MVFRWLIFKHLYILNIWLHPWEHIQAKVRKSEELTRSFLSFLIKLCLSSFLGCFLTTRLPCLLWLPFLLLCLFLRHIKLRGEVVGIFSWKGAVVSQGHMMLQGESLDAVRRWSLSHALYKADAWGTFISFTVWCVSNVTLWIVFLIFCVLYGQKDNGSQTYRHPELQRIQPLCIQDRINPWRRHVGARGFPHIKRRTRRRQWMSSAFS